MIEKTFYVPFIADLALREKQIQQNFRPVIGVHKWFARRPSHILPERVSTLAGISTNIAAVPLALTNNVGKPLLPHLSYCRF